MSRPRQFFLEEAADCLAEAQALLEASPVDRDLLYRAVRRLRGSAQLARFGALAREAHALELHLRRMDGRWGGPDEATREAVRSLERGVEAVRSGRMHEDTELEAGMVEEAGGTGGEGAPEGAPEALVSLDELEYRGTRALARALTLRAPLEDAIVANDPAGPILEELFDLIRLGDK